MKKNHYSMVSILTRVWKHKMLFVMRLTFSICLFCVLQSFGIGTFSQNVRLSINQKNIRVESVIQLIEDKTDYYFMYDDLVVDVSRTVDIEATNELVPEILDNIFKGTDTSYKIEGRLIALSKNGESLSAVQQRRTISGRVTDSSGAALPGVTVVVRGTTTGTITDAQGNYSLPNAPADATLVFSFVGMKTQEVKAGNQTTINISLANETIGIEEVVAIGYGTMKKSDLTGSVASVKSEELTAFPTTNVMQSLAGRAAGVQVSQNSGAPGGQVSIKIRGTNSILGDNNPLYVIDGFPGEIEFVNSGDIESVEILKDASATAIYGARGSNGVVLITTKQGKAGPTKVNYESSYSQQQLIKKMNLMNAKEFAELYYVEKLVNDGKSPRMTENEIAQLGNGTDWQNEVFRTSPIQNHLLNISGGSGKTQFQISGGIYDQKGILPNSEYQRYSLKSNITHNISDKLRVKIGTILSRTIKNVNDNSEWTGDHFVIDMVLYQNPIYKAFNEDGSINRNEETDLAFLYDDTGYSIFDYVKNSSNRYKRNNVNASLEFLYKVTPDLSIKVAGNINNTNYRNDYYRTSKFQGALPSAYAFLATSEADQLQGESLITYSKKIENNHSINLLAGITTEQYIYTGQASSGQGFISDIFKTYDLGSASNIGIPSSSYQKSTLLSYLGRMNYSYKDKYLFTLSMRADGSSRFSEGNKWGYFPSGAFAWKINEENFLKNSSIISDMKLRMGWGRTGSQAISIYATQVLLGSHKAVFNDSYYTAFSPTTKLPGNLKWEATDQINIGTDIGLLKNRFHVTADYYYKKTKDLLNNVQLPSSMGWASTVKNVGEIENRGLEFTFDANDILSGKLKWDLTGNISFNRNKVVKLYMGQSIMGSVFNAVLVKDYVNILQEGHAIGKFYGYLEDGYDDKGQIKFKDLTGDGSISELDKAFIGDPNPDFIYGLNSNLSYGNFSLNLFFQGSYGNDIYNLSSIKNTLYYIYNFNLIRDVYENHWTPENTDAKYPKISDAVSAKMSDRFVEDGSYIRLKNIQLNYDFPTRECGIEWLNKLNLYISGQNLFTLTKYSWWDPDVNSWGGGTSINQGVDYYTYPSYKSITLGLKATF